MNFATKNCIMSEIDRIRIPPQRTTGYKSVRKDESDPDLNIKNNSDLDLRKTDPT